jgi:hypothetical protein
MNASSEGFLVVICSVYKGFEEGHAMNPCVTVLLAATLAGLPAAAAAATARVEYEKPESFTDAGRPRPGAGRGESLGPIRDYFIREIARRLPADQSLDIWITDVDLAGAFEPTQHYYNEVRIVKDRYPPRIELRFRLIRADGSSMKEGTRTLRDPAFMIHGTGDSQDALRYEKAMIDRWLEDEFAR